MNTNTTFVAATNWIDSNEAKNMRKALIANGQFTKDQIKLSSYRWKDTKDHSKGYLAKVLIIKGLHPELELADTKAVKNQTTIESANSSTDSVSMRYFQSHNQVDDTLTA